MKASHNHYTSHDIHLREIDLLTCRGRKRLRKSYAQNSGFSKCTHYMGAVFARAGLACPMHTYAASQHAALDLCPPCRKHLVPQLQQFTLMTPKRSLPAYCLETETWPSHFQLTAWRQKHGITKMPPADSLPHACGGEQRSNNLGTLLPCTQLTAWTRRQWTSKHDTTKGPS